jgi:Glycosyltransferase family 87
VSVATPARRPGGASTRELVVSAAGLVAFVVLPAFALFVVLVDLAGGDAGWPFREAFLGAANAILEGDSPYPGLDDPDLIRGAAYVYPPVTALVVIPFTWLPADLAAMVFAGLLVACVPATLWVVGVRDWRCYGLAFLWPPVLSAIHVENITLVVGLGAALVWRYRDRPEAAGVSLGVSMAVKPLLWPLGLWLLVSRRLLALVWGIAISVIVALGSWAVIGFDGLVDYPDLLRRLGNLMDEWGYSVYALALDLGASHGVSKALWIATALALLAACAVVANRRDDRRAFVLAMALVIASSPIVWLHYFALLLVVVAVARPRLGPVWFVPLVMFASEEIANGTTFQTALTMAAAAVTFGLALLEPTVAQRDTPEARAPVATAT